MPFHDFLQFLLLVALAYYGAIVVGLAIGLKRAPSRFAKSTPFVSVIVAARNEEQTIGRLLESLVNQDYPNYEIIIANDRSTDNTGTIVAGFQSRSDRVSQIRIDRLSDDMPSKKYALRQAILKSRGEILCFTDADCLPGKSWISELVKGFEPRVGLVAGYSPYDPGVTPPFPPFSFSKRLLYRFIEFEEFKGAIWAAGSIGMRKAWLCTGRNLAYRRAVWDEIGGFKKIRHSMSGDDDLLLQAVRHSTDWEIHYLFSPESRVVTTPPASFAEFVRQRRRHFSAGKYFSYPMKTFFFLFHFSNLLLFLGLFGAIFMQEFAIGLWAFFGKFFLDTLLLASGARTFQLEGFRISFLFMEILYVLYNTFLGPLGFIGKVEWKPEG